MASYLDVCRFTPTAGGTSDWTYSTAVTGYQSPTAAGAINGAIYRYRAESGDLSQWELGWGAYNSGTGVFARTTVLFNSAGTTAKISFSTVPQVAIVLMAEDVASPVLPQGRLTLTSGVAVSTSDVSAATTVYYTASQCPISDGTNLVQNVSAQLSIALDSTNTDTGYHQSGKNYDVFKFSDSGTIRIGTGPAWNAGAGSDTARGTGAGSTDLQTLGNTGVLVNTNAITLRWGSTTGNTSSVAVGCAVYLGTIRTTADGQTEDSLKKRFVWNAYNQQPRQMRVIDATVNWTTAAGSSTVRQANANTANQLDFVAGVAGAVSAELQVVMTNSTATVVSGNMGIALDSITTLAVTSILSTSNAGFAISVQKYRSYPGLGRHFLAWLEQGAGIAANTQTWYGSPYSQLTGEIWG